MPSDEEFWKKNERFFTARMGQPCCTLAGISKMLAHLAGNFAVVVHGEMDCLNNFPHVEGVSLHRFFCTHVSQHEFSSGKTAGPLRECLDAVIAELRPDVVFVLSMCLMEMIHDDFPPVAAEVARRTGVPILPLRTSGLEVVSESEYTDDFYRQLAALFPATGEVDADVVNIVGLPAMGAAAEAELRGALGGVRARLFPVSASLDDWRALHRAKLSYVVDASLYPKLAGVLDRRRDVPLPVGVGGTEDFYRAIGAHVDAGAARGAADEFKRRFGGLRLAAGLRMANFNSPAQLALDGLAEIRAFTELGLEVTLLIQGPPDVRGRKYFQARLEALGCDLPSIVFAEPGELAEHLGSGRFDLAYMRDHARQYTQRAGIALITTGTLRPLFAGVLDNVKALTRAAGSRRGASRATVVG